MARQKPGSAVQPIMTALSVTTGSAAIFMPASITRNSMTRPESVRPIQIGQRGAVRADSFDAAKCDMLQLRMQALRSGRVGLLAAAHRGHRRLEVHPRRPEHMAVEILETAAVHEAVILFRSGVGLAAGGDGLLDNPVDARPTVDR